MRLRNKLALPTAGIALLLLILGISGAWYVLRLQRLNSRILDFNVSSVRAAEELEFLVREMRHELDRFLVTQDPVHLTRALEKEADVSRWLEQARKFTASEREAVLVTQIQLGLEEYFPRLHQIAAHPGESGASGAVESLADDVLTAAILASTHEYLELNERDLELSNEQNKAMAQRVAIALLMLGTSGAIAGLVAGYGVARGISRSIWQLSVPIRDVAGKLSEIVGPVEISADPGVAELETMLQVVSAKVGAVVEQLHARHREVIRADQLAAVGQLAAGLAHEIRNPLMCMKTLVQSARRRGDKAPVDSRDLRVLDEEIARLENLLQAFLDFARPSAPDKQDVDLVHVIRQTVAILSKKAEGRHVAIDSHLPDEPLVVQADAAQLKQVVLNLLLNALDAVPNGGTIWVDAGLESDLGTNGRTRPHLRLRVADNGRGLPDSRHRIYEPFFSTKETGLGLGLAISRRIIDAHGGDLRARDRDGGGTMLEILLPVHVSVEPRPA